VAVPPNNPLQPHSETSIEEFSRDHHISSAVPLHEVPHSAIKAIPFEGMFYP
jgi:hypothetical protein